jgi:glycosyltransferase involved in cell wall biosynthesis
VGKFTGQDVPKGVEDIIRAFAGTMWQGQRPVLMIVGVNRYEREDAFALLQESGIARDDAILIEHQPRSNAIEFMKASDVLIMNYSNTRHHARHTSPMKLFEYMALQRPIVAPALSGITEVVDADSAYLFEPDNIASMSTSIQDAFDDTGARPAEALKRVRSHTWKRRAQEILAHITR